MDRPENNAIRKLLIHVNRTDGIYYRFAKRVGMKENTLALFYALSDNESHSQKEICEEWMIPRTTINTIVRECAEEGVVRLKKGDRTKEKELLLTGSGKERVNALMRGLFVAERKAYERTVDRYGEEFVSAFSSFVNALEEELLRDEPKGNGEYHEAKQRL